MKEFAYRLCSEHIPLNHRPLCNLSVFGDGQPEQTNRAVNKQLDEVLVISRIIKVEVGVISRSRG